LVVICVEFCFLNKTEASPGVAGPKNLVLFKNTGHVLKFYG